MRADDLVDLVFITPSNHLYVNCIPRRQASKLIRDWFNAREKVRVNEADAADCADWLHKATFALNASGDDGADFALWAIGWESVLGMYTRERKDLSTQERAVKVMEKMATIAEKEMKRGDEWREGEEGA